MQDTGLIIVADLLILAILVVIKTIFFYRAAHRRSFGRWFFFRHFDVINASSTRVKKLRKWQNALSVILIVLFLFSIIFIYMLGKGSFWTG